MVFHHTDHLLGGSVDTNENGEIVQLLDYYPFGGVRIDETSGDYENDYKFTGKELDEDTGLYYYEARYHDARIGRFISKDPLNGNIENPQSQNAYSYVQNNSLKYIDPDGKEAVLTIDDKKKKMDIEATIFIYGSGASEERANKIESAINSKWTGKYTGMTMNNETDIYDIQTNVNVLNVDKKPDYLSQHENSVEINSRFFHRSEVSIWSNGQSNAGNWTSWDSGTTYAHEAGHLFGLDDHYRDIKIGGVGLFSVSDKEFGKSLMGANPFVNKPNQQDINNLVRDAYTSHINTKLNTTQYPPSDVTTTHLLNYGSNGR